METVGLIFAAIKGGEGLDDAAFRAGLCLLLHCEAKTGQTIASNAGKDGEAMREKRKSL